MNQKIVAVFFIYVIISITPTSAVEFPDIQNDIESIKYSQQHFGFCQCFKLMGKVYKLMKHVCQINIFPIISESKSGREEIGKVSKDRLLQRTVLIKYLKEKDRIENQNQNNDVDTKITDKIKQINKIKPHIKEFNVINETENSTKDSNQFNETQNSTTGSNQFKSTHNNTPISNTTKVIAEMVEAPVQAVNHANEIKSKLDKKGLHVKINNLHGSIEGLKLNDIVQLIESHGYIKYWIFKGINENVTDKKAVILYNGKTNVDINLRIFKRSFTGIIMNLDGDYQVKKVTNRIGQRIKIYTPIKDNQILKDTQSENNLVNKSIFPFQRAFKNKPNSNNSYLTESGFTPNKVGLNTENDDVTVYDVVDEIYQIQKETLEDSINNSDRIKAIAGLLKGLGIGLSILSPIIGGLGAAFFAMPEPLISKLAAVVLAIIALVVLGLAMLSYFYGLGLETDILFKESLEKNELTNLESREL